MRLHRSGMATGDREQHDGTAAWLRTELCTLLGQTQKQKTPDPCQHTGKLQTRTANSMDTSQGTDGTHQRGKRRRPPHGLREPLVERSAQRHRSQHNLQTRQSIDPSDCR